jgi:hypothetical protein
VHKVAKVGVVDHAAVDAACAPRDARHALRAELRPRVLCHVQRRRRLDGQRHSVEFARQTARETCVTSCATEHTPKQDGTRVRVRGYASRAGYNIELKLEDDAHLRTSTSALRTLDYPYCNSSRSRAPDSRRRDDQDRLFPTLL